VSVAGRIFWIRITDPLLTVFVAINHNIIRHACVPFIEVVVSRFRWTHSNEFECSRRGC